MITLLVAAADNDAIGKNNKLLWTLPNDMKFFKNTTWGMVVIMGRKTFESLGKALPGRTNIVITSKKDWTAKDVQTAHSIDEALELAAHSNCKEYFIIGGGEIYRQCMSIANKALITRVHHSFDADTYFTGFNPAEWVLKEKLDFTKDEKHDYDYSFETWVKK